MIKTAPVPPRQTNFGDSREVGELLDRVRAQPMPVRYVTKGVAKNTARPRRHRSIYRRLIDWVAR